MVINVHLQGSLKGTYPNGRYEPDDVESIQDLLVYFECEKCSQMIYLNGHFVKDRRGTKLREGDNVEIVGLAMGG